jgi:hypothetical protein
MSIYYILVDGDIIEAGDEYFSDFTNQWIKMASFDHAIGRRWNQLTWSPMRRKMRDLHASDVF